MQSSAMRNPYAADPALAHESRTTRDKRSVKAKRQTVKRKKPGQRKAEKEKRESGRRTTTLQWGAARLRFKLGRIPSGFESYGNDCG